MNWRKKLLATALWTAFGLLWVFIAIETAIHPVVRLKHGLPILLILEITMVVLCGVVAVRIMRSR